MATTPSTLSGVSIGIVKEGWLLKQGQINKSFKKRWCVLRTNQTIDYYDIPKDTKQKMDSSTNLNNGQSNIKYTNTKPTITKNGQTFESLSMSKIYKGTVHLKNSKNVGIHNNQKQGFCFSIDTPKRKWIFATDSNDNRELWINYLRQSCNYYILTQNEMYIKLPKDKKYKKQLNSQLKRDYFAFQVTLTSSQLILKLKTPIKTLSKLHDKDNTELSMSNSYNWTNTTGGESVSKSPPIIISPSHSRTSSMQSQSQSQSHDNSYSHSNSNSYSHSRSQSKRFLKWNKDKTDDPITQNGSTSGNKGPTVIDENKSESKCETLPNIISNGSKTKSKSKGKLNGKSKQDKDKDKNKGDHDDIRWNLHEIGIIKCLKGNVGGKNGKGGKSSSNHKSDGYCWQILLILGRSEKFSPYVKIYLGDGKVYSKWKKMFRQYCFNAQYKE